MINVTKTSIRNAHISRYGPYRVRGVTDDQCREMSIGNARTSRCEFV